MTTVTLEHVRAEHEKLAEMIAKIEADMNKPSFFEYQGKRIPLEHGERYVGTIICSDGANSRHVILLPGERQGNWKGAMEWAASIGGELPDRVEGALLFATMKDEFKSEAYWTREQHAADSDYAWCQYFDDGYQHYYNTSDKLRARAVRRLAIQ